MSISTKQKLSKVESIINSCKTYDQVLTCFSFVRGTFFNGDLLSQSKVLSMIQKKSYEMRRNDLNTYINQSHE